MVAIHKPSHDVILKPVVSEKSYAASDRGQYTFVVAPNANKVQIKQAVEEIFNVKVTNVNTLNRAGAPAPVSVSASTRSAPSSPWPRARRSTSSVTEG